LKLNLSFDNVVIFTCIILVFIWIFKIPQKWYLCKFRLSFIETICFNKFSSLYCLFN